MRKPFSIFLLSLLSLILTIPFSQAAQDGVVTVELWCVAKNNAEDAALQSALDWACGAGGANCGPIQQGGPCYDPTDIQTMASYAFNDYFLRSGLTEDGCNFANNAALTSLNPSNDKCKLPSSFTVKNGSLSSSSTTVDAAGQYNADMSSCSQVGYRWGWTIMSIYLFLAIIWIS